MAEQRFWSKVNKTDICWVWTGCRNKKGYGSFYCKKKIASHRYSYIIHNGNIPNGLLVRHTCDNPSCVNPAHLILGTNQDNVNDKMKRGRHNCGRGISHGFVLHPEIVPKGENHGRSKLTEDDIHQIRILYEFNYTLKELGKLYGVSFANISRIIRREAWSHI